LQPRDPPFRRGFPTSVGFLLTALFAISCAASIIGEDVRTRGTTPPVTGKKSPGVERLDAVMLWYLQKIGCSTGVLAVSDRGRLIHSRGYGWSDARRTMPTRPDTMIGIASCEKSITSAAILRLSRKGQLDLDSPVFTLLKTKPLGQVADNRIWQITVRHLLEHKAGWQGEPVERAAKLAHALGNRDPVPTEIMLGAVMVQQLRDDPGTKYEYCNLCFDALRQVVAKVYHRPAIAYFRTELFRDYGIKDLSGLAASAVKPKLGDPPLVWNAAEGGPVSASAPALCTFMKYYWFGGEPRDNGNPWWERDGSLPGSTAMMLWRSDGIDLVFIFNGRGATAHKEIRTELESALDKIK
jgi:CubicO group peptidase (beta-lactamase class C family)